MEIKVKAVEGYDNKSKAEVEQELLKKHEDSLDNQDSDVPKIDTSALDKPTEEKNNDESEVDSSQDKTPSSELNDEDVLSFIKKRYNKEINSVEELSQLAGVPRRLC